MKRFLFIFLLTSSLIYSVGCKNVPLIIHYYNTEIIIDGLGNEFVWQKIKGYSKFESPWDGLPDQGTVFKSFHNGEYLYFHFDIKDTMVICYNHKSNDTAVEYSDRVELFFALDSTMTQYCGLEFDPCNRRQEFFSNGYRQFTKNWKFPALNKGDFVSMFTDGGYQVEGKLSMKGLADLGMIKNGYINLGVFRADCQSQNLDRPIRWISWKNINTKRPDFHTYEGFRKIQLEPSYSKAQ